MSHSNQSFSQPKSWDLSLYELHRTPQETITDDTKIAISPRSLHSELMCPICLDMLTGTMTTKECLHRFCHDCITTALRNGNKECPTCRKKLISKRSLRKDPNFDSLIQKIYPDRDEYEAHQEKVMEKLNQHTNQQALTNSIEEGLRLQAQNRLQRMLKQQQKRAAEAAAQEAAAQEAAAQEAAETATTNSQGESRQVNHSTNDPTTDESIGNKSIKIEVSCVDSSSLTTVSSPSTTKASSSTSLGKRKRKESVDSDQSSQSYLENPEHVELIFYPHPNSPSCYVDQQQLRYIKTTTNASVEHLTKYLSLRLMIDTKSNEETNSNEKRHDDTFDLYLQHIEEYDKLEGNLTLLQIQNTYWKENRPIELFFLPKVNPNE